MIGEVTRYQPWGRLKLMKGCSRKALTELRSLLPANDQMLFTSAPATQGPLLYTATAAGPADHLPRPRLLSLAVGNTSVGPKPKVQAPLPLGTKKKLGFRSPMPF